MVGLADGNPLYTQEYARMMIQRGGLPAGPDSAELPMPDSVHAVIANRVDLLEPADRTVLQAAAVVGTQFWPGAVTAAVGGQAGSVERSLRRLEQRAFICEQLESSMAGQREFRFQHLLVRDVCYQRLPRTERVARHDRTADWLEGLSQRRDTDLAEVLAHHRWAAHEIARSLGMQGHQRARSARRLLQLAARRAYALHALDAAAGHIARALSLLDAGGEPEPAVTAERWRLELFAAEIAFYRDRTGFLAGGGADRLHALAQQLTRAAQVDGAAARAWTLLGQVAWLRADRDAAVRWLSRAVWLFEPLPDSPEKVDAHAELGRLHMLNYESGPAIAAAGVAATIAGRLGLVEAQANAQITTATARYESGDPAGLAELRDVHRHCREHQLLALRRAARNLAHLLREEGDLRGSEELVRESQALDGPGGHNILPEQEGDLMRAYFTGDLDALAGADLSDEGGWAERREMRACGRALRGDPAAADDAAAALAAARKSGFHRPLWGAIAAAALCHALQQRRTEATALLVELIGDWQKASVIASGEWVSRAAHAAALAGPDPAEALRAPLAELSRRTPWSEAALRTVAGAVALAQSDPDAAGRHHLAAAAIYERIPTVTDRMLSLALAGAAFAEAGDAGPAASALAPVRAFATERRAPGLLQIAER